jgi:aspartate racemase
MHKKKKLGILGGMGSRAGAMLFSKVLDYSPALKDQDFIEILIHSNSAVPDRTRAIVHKAESPVNELLRSIKLLNDSYVDFIIMACVTSYYFHRTLQLHSRARILDPIDIIKKHIQDQYPTIKKIGLLATAGTIQSGIFHQAFDGTGMTVVTLDDRDTEDIFMKSVYMQGGLKSSEISGEAIDLFFQSIPKILDQGAEVIIGGCTEVQLVLKENMLPIPYIDSMDLAAREAVKLCYDLDLHPVTL